MGIEIERKFLVKEGWTVEENRWEFNSIPVIADICQGYLTDGNDPAVRVRTSQQSNDSVWPGKRESFLTLKFVGTGASRPEYEWKIPWEEARDLMGRTGTRIIEKTRHTFYQDGTKWEVDVFKGRNQGLIIAECELETEDQKVILPRWITREVTDDHRYENVALSVRPFTTWDLDAVLAARAPSPPRAIGWFNRGRRYL